MNPEKQRELISKELSKNIRGGIVIPTTVIVALAGAGCTQQTEITSVESETQVSQTSKESPTVAQTETKETTTVKEVENIIPITLISDESLPNLKWEWRGKTYIPQEVVYKDAVEGPKQMEKALLLTWAYVFRDRLKDPDFQNIPEENADLLLSTLEDKLNKGEDLTFEIEVNEKADERGRKVFKKVDLSQGVKIIFVGELTGLYDVNGTPFSEDYFVLQHDKTHKPVYAVGYEVSDSGAMTIKIFSGFPRDESFCSSVAGSFEILVTQQTKVDPSVEFKMYKGIRDALFIGNEWKGDKWIKFGTPILERIVIEE